jgi:hypothetical protein
MEKIKEFVAVRTFRQARLDRTFMDYENLNEYKEGLRNILNTSLCALVRISVQLKRCIINRDSMKRLEAYGFTGLEVEKVRFGNSGMSFLQMIKNESKQRANNLAPFYI